MTWENPSATERQRMLRETRAVAVVGASPNPSRASNFVGTYLLASTGYDVYFVNPNATEILGRPVYKTLADLPVVPDLVDVFRRPQDLPAVLDEVLALPSGVRTFWLQFGLFDEDLARRAEAAGLQVVMDRCLKVEHARFHGGLHLAGFDTGVISSRRRGAVTAVVTRRGPWREGDPVGHRLFLDVGPLDLELGGHLPDVRIAYETWGTPAADMSNAVLIQHALSGDSHVVGEAGEGHPTPGWWSDIVGPGGAIDTDRWFVVCTNVLGGCQGSTGPSSLAPDGRAWGSRWPATTIRDQVAAEVPLADALGVRRWAAVIGGSMGGMRALEWAVIHPGRVERVVVLAAAAEASADQVGLCRIQVDAVRADPHWHDGDYAAHGVTPDTGLGIGRRIAHLSYRTAHEVDTRFGRAVQADGRFAVESYLDHAADGLVARFDAGSYVALNLAMNSYEIGRGRGGLAAALAGIPAEATVVGVDTDRLYPLHQQQALADMLGVDLQVVTSERGHDGFLVEVPQVAAILRKALDGG